MGVSSLVWILHKLRMNGLLLLIRTSNKVVFAVPQLVLHAAGNNKRQRNRAYKADPHLNKAVTCTVPRCDRQVFTHMIDK